MKEILSTRPTIYSSSSILISILYLVGLIDWSCNSINKRHNRGRGRPYLYSSTTTIIQCFIVSIWFRLDSNRSLHHFLSADLPYNRKVVKACGLSELQLPSRRTFDRRLKTVSNNIRERIATMGNLFVLQDLVNPYILAIDSTLLRSKGKVWHKSSMEKGIVPCPGIDMDARWGFRHTTEVGYLDTNYIWYQVLAR